MPARLKHIIGLSSPWVGARRSLGRSPASFWVGRPRGGCPHVCLSVGRLLRSREFARRVSREQCFPASSAGEILSLAGREVQAASLTGGVPARFDVVNDQRRSWMPAAFVCDSPWVGAPLVPRVPVDATLVHLLLSRGDATLVHLQLARVVTPRWCFPASLAGFLILQKASLAGPSFSP